MTIQPQIHPIVDFGTPAEFLAQRIEEAGIISVDTSDVVSITRLNLTRLVIGGSGANAAKYYVNAAGSVPNTGFTSVQTIVNQAVTDGHTSSANPAVILMYPGSFVENVSLPAGISLCGLIDDTGDQKSPYAGAEIVGTVTISPAAGSNALENLRIVGRLICGGAAAVGLAMNNVYVLQGAAFAATDATMAVSNASLILLMNRVFLEVQAGATTPPFSVTGAASVDGFDVSFLGLSTGQAVDLNAGSVTAFRDSRLQGKVSISTASSLNLTDSSISVTGANPAVTLANASTVTMLRGSISSANAVEVNGTGTFIQQSVIRSNVAGTIATTVTSTTIFPETHLVKEVVIAPAGAMTTLDEAFTVTAVAGNTTMTLLALNVVPQGYECSIKKVSDGNAVVVGRAGADTIDGQISVTLAATTQGAVRLRAAGGVAPTWRIVGSYGLVTCP